MRIVLSLELPAQWLEGKGLKKLKNKKNKYNILKRMIVENIIPGNMIINLGCTSVDNHIPRDDIFDYHSLKNVIF